MENSCHITSTPENIGLIKSIKRIKEIVKTEKISVIKSILERDRYKKETHKMEFFLENKKVIKVHNEFLKQIYCHGTMDLIDATQEYKFIDSEYETGQLIMQCFQYFDEYYDEERILKIKDILNINEYNTLFYNLLSYKSFIPVIKSIGFKKDIIIKNMKKNNNIHLNILRYIVQNIEQNDEEIPNLLEKLTCYIDRTIKNYKSKLHIQRVEDLQDIIYVLTKKINKKYDGSELFYFINNIILLIVKKNEYKYDLSVYKMTHHILENDYFSRCDAGYFADFLAKYHYKIPENEFDKMLPMINFKYLDYMTKMKILLHKKVDLKDIGEQLNTLFEEKIVKIQ